MHNNKNPVLVCGGAGYIGSHVVHHLLTKGHSVVVVDDLSTGHAASVPDNVELIRISIGDKESLAVVFKHYIIQAVVHLCANAYVGESMENPQKYYRNNISNGLILLETMLKFHVRQFVFSSSCAVYGAPRQLPIIEECPIAPISPYGHTKAMFEQILSDYSRAYNLRYCALRYFNAAGAIENGMIGEDHRPETHIIPLVLEQAKKKLLLGSTNSKFSPLKVFGTDYATPDGTCIRDYVHVMELASAHKLALDYLHHDGESIAINLANRKGFSVLDVIKTSEKIVGCTIPYETALRRPGDPDEVIGTAEKAYSILGWTPKHSDIDNIIATAWKWHSSFPEGYPK